MAIQLSDTVRNARLDAIETAIGTGARLKIRSGAPPATVATADSGDVLADITCPTDYFSAASGGVMAKLGTWEDTSADAAGTADHFRIYASDGTTAHMQGTVGTAAEDLVVDNDVFAAGQQFTITAFSLTDGNA